MTLNETESDLLDVEEKMSNSEDDDNNAVDSDNQSDGSEKESDNDNSDTEKAGTNAGWADSVAKILKTKKPKGKKTLVLSKAKKLSDVKIKKPTEIGFQIDGEIKEEKPDLSTLDEIKEEADEPAKKKRKELPSIRVKPNILDKDRERTLSKIATRGVVQLFNSVRMQQKDIDEKLKEAGPLERKRENVMKSIDKRAFLDVLMDKKSQPVDGEVKDEAKQESKGKTQTDSTWNVLRDDFMMGAKLKDWDKEIEEENDDASEEISDSD